MNFSGINKTTLLDYPNHLACMLFVSGCNFRCPYCHNSSLVLNESTEVYFQQDILNFLNKRVNILEGVCISGGEPTIYEDLKDFIIKIKASTSLKVKIDTNGTNPKLIKELINERLIDYVAMDIKSDIENYLDACGVKDHELLDNIKKSIDLLKENKVDYEFRTTVVKGIHTLRNFENIGKMLKGESKYYIQNYLDSGDILYKRNNKKDVLTGFNESELNKIKNILGGYLSNVIIRNK
ncbi:anaerobic ribonucleoside-triphosphate reductase activating protein [Clostridium sp.]|uniref:anaerobic ribonucleoside-triphosphate reductase activating protein n=1 Tax=Clostridium sp. TaxID=1506 RepID=UPI003D6CF2D3